jgi:hypothetical protein
MTSCYWSTNVGSLARTVWKYSTAFGYSKIEDIRNRLLGFTQERNWRQQSIVYPWLAVNVEYISNAKIGQAIYVWHWAEKKIRKKMIRKGDCYISPIRRADPRYRSTQTLALCESFRRLSTTSMLVTVRVGITIPGSRVPVLFKSRNPGKRWPTIPGLQKFQN